MLVFDAVMRKTKRFTGRLCRA